MKLDTKKYEARLEFLKNELYIKRDELNQLLLESGQKNIFHNFLVEASDLREKYPDALLEFAHNIQVIYPVRGDLVLHGKLRNLEDELNSLFEEASRMNIHLTLEQDIAYLDELPIEEDVEYTGRWSLVLKVSAPNLDDSLVE